MKPALSLKWVIGGGASLVLAASLVIYLHTVTTFSQHALDYIASYMLEEEALYFSKRYEEDPFTPLPQGPNFSAVIGTGGLPERLRALLQKKPSRQIGTVLIFDETDFAHIQVQRLHDGKILYLFETQHDGGNDEKHEHHPSDKFWEAGVNDLLWIALSVPIIALLLIALLVYRVISPLRRLTRWSATMGDPETGQAAHPNFCYKEFNQLAASLADSVQRVKASTLREERLLRYTSHELRTPLAVLKANLQLLETRGELSPALQRIQRSVRDMQGITETLLWMSSSHSKALVELTVHMDQLLDELLEDNRYLINTRHLTLMIKLQEGPYPLPSNACRIVIGNLLRNALQYAEQGCIEITCDSHTFTMVNRVANTPIKTESADYGYSLGLELVQLLCEKLDWHLHRYNEEQFFTVRLVFPGPTPSLKT